MEIKEGMYVRTKWGIAKVTDIDGEFIYVDRCFQPIDETKCDKNDIIGEPSEHIIDLIEPGDYVNGKKVGYVDSCTGYFREFYYDDEDHEKEYGNWLEEIETVVTKEQFAKCVYEVDHE